MIIGILLIMLVIFLLGCLGEIYEESCNGDYRREIDKAIKDMKKGITTVITDEPNSAFSVKKYKDGKKL